MPLFASLTDMQARFEEAELIQLSDEAGAGVIDAARIDQKLASSDALITSYIAARHRDTASFAGHPLLTDVACDYAFSLLWKTDPPKWVEDRRKIAISTLKSISDGTIKLDQGEEQAAPRPDAIITSGSERKLGRDSMSGF